MNDMILGRKYSRCPKSASKNLNSKIKSSNWYQYTYAFKIPTVQILSETYILIPHNIQKDMGISFNHTLTGS